MTDIIDTVQLQSIDDSLIELFEITLQGSTDVDVRLVSGLQKARVIFIFRLQTDSL
jgi:hypothetical protein